jgi:hypothetical protein
MKVKKIKNLKAYLNFLFNFFILKFFFAFMTRSIVYLDCFKGKKKDVSEAVVTNKYQSVYFLPLILAKFNPHITPETEPIISYSFSMFILSLLVLICFFNIIGYIISIHLITKYNIENKFPYFKRYIKFYSSTNHWLLVLEIVIAFFFLICIVILNFFLFTTTLMI